MGTLFSFLFFTALVGLVTYLRTRKENLSSSKGYFLGGKTLNGWVIAGSLLLTNLSAANFTGMTGMVYGGNLAPVAWTVTVIPPLIFFGGAILPIFLRSGFATMPELLEHRFGPSTRRLVALLFLFSYVLSGMPVALYGGAIAFIHLFNVEAALGLSETACVWIIVWTLGIVGGIYALLGGLKGVAISDTLNGIGLFVGGILVFVFGVRAVGHGEFLPGVHQLFTEHTEKLDVIGAQGDMVPFAVLFTGMLLHNLYYWCTNQYIIQRTFGARSLEQGQKGVLIAAFFKVLNVLYIAIPGVIAYHLYGPGHFANNDWAYPTLVRDTMPPIFSGFFAAVMFGAVLTTFIGALNSAVTLFAIDIYQPIWGRGLSEAEVVKRSKRAGLWLGLATMVIAPFIMWFREGIFQYMLKVQMLFGAPIFLTLLVGIFFRHVSARAINVTLISFLVIFGLPLFGLVDLSLNYLHVLAILFVVHFVLALGLARLMPAKREPRLPPAVTDIELRPWKHFRSISVAAILLMIQFYVVFSPVGLVRGAGPKNISYGFVAGGIALGALIFTLPLWRRRDLAWMNRKPEADRVVAGDRQTGEDEPCRQPVA